MNRQSFEGLNFKIKRIPAWQIVLIIAGVLALGLALAVVATGIFLIAFPVMLLAGVAYRFFGARVKPATATASHRRHAPGDVIETDYRVIDPDKPSDR